jgi:hypothetical protein
VAILNGVVDPQGFMLPRIKMCFVKLKGDEKVQEMHQNANCKKVPSGGHQDAGRQEELVMN